MSIVNCLSHSFFHCHLICLVKQTTVRLSIIIFKNVLLKDKPSVTYPLNAAQLLPLHSTWLPCGTHFSEGPQTYKQFSMSNLQDFQWHPVLVLPSSSQYPRHKGEKQMGIIYIYISEEWDLDFSMISPWWISFAYWVVAPNRQFSMRCLAFTTSTVNA
jgi:hypothetical protein